MKRRRSTPRFPIGFLLAAWLAAGLSAVGAAPGSKAQKETLQQREEKEDYFDNWLKEVAVYIITPEERSVFQELSTPEEKEHFIEQFWYRRDRDKRTPTNEFKAEHYRRLAYVDEHYSAGWPGWMTDRGKIYIIHGPPDEIEALPSGGEYERQLYEGGGRTSVYPYEKWRYRYIEGVGSNVEIEFVDRDFSGVYKLALSSEEKDAFLHVPNAGFTAAEQLGLATRQQRPYYAPSGSYPLMNYREKDSAFARYETFVNVQRPKKIKYQDLKEIVDLKVSYSQLPLRVRSDVFRLDGQRALIPITLAVRNSDLTFKAQGGSHQAKLAVYGVITSITNRLVTEFEDQLTTSFSSRDLTGGLRRSSVYNRVVLLDQGGRYKLQLVVKDLEDGRVGVETRSIVVPSFGTKKLAISSLVLSGYITPVEDFDDPDQMFVLGNVRVRPSLSKRFSRRDYFAVYAQLYNVSRDESTLKPSFEVRYRIQKGDETLVDLSDEVGESVQYFSPQRMVLIKKLPLSDLRDGQYRVELAFKDRISDQFVRANDSFTVDSGQ
ncbi:MAG: GWxTD domain-containing protein [Acidobacteriota bacterium]